MNLPYSLSDALFSDTPNTGVNCENTGVTSCGGRSAARAGLVGFAASITIALSGCSENVSQRETNQELRQQIFLSCLKALPAGPQVTKYNDWDEVVDSCESAAYYQSQQCISGTCLKAQGQRPAGPVGSADAPGA